MEQVNWSLNARVIDMLSEVQAQAQRNVIRTIFFKAFYSGKVHSINHDHPQVQTIRKV